ncbi:MAG: glucoamylase family protein, partial [Chthoniobacterales bacterium]
MEGPPGATFHTIGHRGFCYHFLEMKTGRRAWECEVSFIDTTLLLAGMLVAASYFGKRTKEEKEIRSLVQAFYERIEWTWALNGGETLAMAWKPGKGFASDRWKGYNEGLLLYLLGLASPTHPLPPESYHAFTATYKWRALYGKEFLYAGPLFIHHFPHAWIDFRGIRDRFMREHDCDYFENSRRAALIQRQYAIENKRGFKGYGKNCWGLNAGDGPSNRIVKVGNKRYPTLGYAARGVPDGPDDGTLMPSAAVASLPFAPEISMAAFRHFLQEYPGVVLNYHMPSGFNPSLRDKKGEMWISDGYYALDQGIMVLMLENFRSQLVWNLLRKNRYIVKGLRRAGFEG